MEEAITTASETAVIVPAPPVVELLPLPPPMPLPLELEAVIVPPLMVAVPPAPPVV
jgi:hypothetical protein